MNRLIMKSAIFVLGCVSLVELSYARPQVSVLSKEGYEVIPNDWTGFYGGLSVGAIFNRASLNANHFGFISPTGVCNRKARFSSFFPGLQLGYLRQLDSNLVWGVEADYTYNSRKRARLVCVCDHLSTIADRFTVKNQQQGSLRGRIGYAVNNRWLPFFTAGGSLADLGAAYGNEGGDYYSKNTTRLGWVVGAGLEWSLSPAWSVRAEYYYDDYGQAVKMKIPTVYQLHDPNGGLKANLNANNLRLAINYWFS